MTTKRVITVSAIAAALVLLLGVGAVVGGGLLYRAVSGRSLAPIAQVRETASNLVQALTGRGGVTRTASAAAASTPAVEEGILVAHVVADSPAAQAGLRRGDIIMKVGDQAVNQPSELTASLKALKTGDSLTLTIQRGDAERTLTVTLGERNQQPYLGIVPCADGQATMPATTNGVFVVEVEKDSAAQKAGLQSGDQIISVDGQALDADHSLSDLIGAHKPGDKVSLEVQRAASSETVTLEATLGENPQKAGTGYLGVRVAGQRFHAPTDGQPQMPFFGHPNGDGGSLAPNMLPDGVQQGALVVNVVADSPAAQAGLQPGDVIKAVNEQEISATLTLPQALANFKPGDKVTLTVARTGEKDDLKLTATLGENPNQAGKAYLGVRAALIERRDGSGNQDFPFDFPGLPFGPNIPSPAMPAPSPGTPGTSL
ncbi:PDZ domain-containing protein [Candidatus Amarolinea aalborgensis]|jgi:S1-C subfamily serine protease|uniref:PDZ domain-containing protein n=1 Tax=Candidatus Amarolinea aalborgensis TaxID=2249329 RepID=UPI003BFA361C